MGGVDKTMLISNEINKDIIHTYIIIIHFESNSVLSDSQFGFRKGHSTIVPLMVAVHHWHQVLFFSTPVRHLTVCFIKPT